jgi:glucosylglycerate synthase
MADTKPLPQDVAELLREQGAAEVVVGLPSYNNVSTIAPLVRQVREGLRESFPGLRSIIVNTDSGSTDGTTQELAALATGEGAVLVRAVVPNRDIVIPYHGIPGKGDGLRLTLQVAQQAGARLCIMLSPDLTSFQTSWIRQLGVPILDQGFDFVVPVFVRHRLDGAINSSIVRPLVGSLYGKQIRQPMGGDYAFSAPLVGRYLAQPIWETDLARFGTDIWTTTQAICGSFKLCQVHLGLKTQSSPTAPPDLGTALTQVLSCLFEDMSRNASIWQKIRGSQSTPMLGAVAQNVPSTVSFDSRNMVESFRLGLRNLKDLWSLVLPPATLLDLDRLGSVPVDDFTMPDALWCRVVFDFALGYRLRPINRNHLLGAFLPLYLAWLGSFAREMQDATNSQAERRIQQLCQSYESQKPYLISRWRSPDRFSP